jgi:hypothetical protein
MANSERQKPLTPKQKKLVALLPKIESGEMTKTAAILQAGYTESSAREQSRVMGSIGNNAVMQAALRKAGVNEDLLSQSIREGLTADEKGTPDYRTRSVYVKIGADLLDAFPTQRHQILPPPATYVDLEEPKANSPEEARRLAEQES